MEKREEQFGFWWSVNTPLKVRQVLANAYKFKYRVRVYCGDTETGQAWLEELDIIGRIGRSTGSEKIPLLIKTSRSHGGGGLLDHCIVAIQDVENKKFLYQHERFNVPALTVRPISPDNAHATQPQWAWEVVKIQGGELQARFASKEKAQRYIDFMYGRRMSK